ncbi:MAG: ATP-binding protein [Alphaproteobacteria bacterium]|nr:ATP-binding protein [Alphaproteobacteria bacterium]MCB9697389.1 ATP-binding protein [Alphaproteobacteria bacterium]
MDWFLRNDRERFFAYVDAVKALVPGVTDIRIATPDPSTRRIDLVREGGWVTPADDASSGVRLLLLFLALAWHPSPPDLVLIEEPENGLHPERIREMMALLRGLTEGAHAPAPVQVVLTTHSPYVLSCVRIPQDQVLVFERHEDGSCGAKPLDPDRVRPFLDDFGLGEVWANEGEAGLVAP